MDKISKALKNLSDKEKKAVKFILSKITINNLAGLEVKKLKGHKNIYRIRKGDIRIIYLSQNNNIKLLTIERRGDNTYNF
jgi:mRNA-degrading endonuclease RelE of RelBE toxin-antitoxin system